MCLCMCVGSMWSAALQDLAAQGVDLVVGGEEAHEKRDADVWDGEVCQDDFRVLLPDGPVEIREGADMQDVLLRTCSL